MSNYNDINALIKSLTGKENIFSVNKIYLEMLGELDAAVFLSQLVYWSDKSKRNDGFFYKTYSEWKEEIYITEYALRKLTKHFIEIGFLETKVKKANGNPTTHYKVHMNAITDSLLEFVRNKENANEDSNLRIQSNESEISKEGSFVTNDSLTTITSTNTTTNKDIKDNTSTTSPKKVSKTVKKVYEEDHAYYKLSELLYKQVIKTAPRTKKPNMQNWCEEIRKLVELDNVTDFKEIQDVILFAHNDSFWRINILSTKKLRSNYATLHAKMITPKGGNKNGTYWTSNGGTTETDTSQININESYERFSKENAHKFKPVDTTMHDVF